MTESPPPGNPPIIFLLDIDGTLMPTSDIDDRCFWRAIDDVLGGAPERTLAHYQIPDTGRDQLHITYIGDGIWDLEASRELGWEFIGIAAKKQELKLKEAGARLVVGDFNQLRNRHGRA